MRAGWVSINLKWLIYWKIYPSGLDGFLIRAVYGKIIRRVSLINVLMYSVFFSGPVSSRACIIKVFLTPKSSQKLSNNVRDTRHFEKSARAHLPRRFPDTWSFETERHGRRHGTRTQVLWIGWTKRPVFTLLIFFIIPYLYHA